VAERGEGAPPPLGRKKQGETAVGGEDIRGLDHGGEEKDKRLKEKAVLAIADKKRNGSSTKKKKEFDGRERGEKKYEALEKD